VIRTLSTAITYDVMLMIDIIEVLLFDVAYLQMLVAFAFAGRK
jgi:hypothetical protein